MGKTQEVRTSLLAHFQIEAAFKGIQDNTVNIDVGTGGGNGDCGYDFKAGERYIVYGFGKSIQGPIVTSICTRTQPLPEGQNDIDLLQAFLKGEPQTRIFGNVSLFGRELGNGPFDMKRQGAAAGVSIEAQSEATILKTTTDGDGKFEFRNVKDGTYVIRPILPATQSGYLGMDESEKVIIRLPAMCGSDVHLLIQTNGVIRGRLFDVDGNPVAQNVEVSILEAKAALGSPARFIGSSTWTREGGTYEFKGLMPGDYVIGAGVLHPPDWRSSYSRVYYPSGRRIIDTQVLHLAEGEKLSDIDIHLPPALLTFTLKGIVFESSGRPAPGAQIEVFDLDYNMAIEKPEVLFKTGSDGSFAVTALKGRRYAVRAYRALDYFAGTGVQSEAVEITTTDELKPIILTLTKPGILRTPKQ